MYAALNILKDKEIVSVAIVTEKNTFYAENSKIENNTHILPKNQIRIKEAGDFYVSGTEKKILEVLQIFVNDKNLKIIANQQDFDSLNLPLSLSVVHHEPTINPLKQATETLNSYKLSLNSGI